MSSRIAAEDITFEIARSVFGNNDNVVLHYLGEDLVLYVYSKCFSDVTTSVNRDMLQRIREYTRTHVEFLN